MDQGTGTAVQDQSMYGNNGTLSGGYWGPGYSGSGLCFSSDGQGVIIPDAPSINVTTGISICAWINGNYSSQTCAIAYKTYDYFLALSNRRLYGGLVTSQGISKVWGVTPMPSSTWTFVAMTYDRTSGGYPTDLLDCDGFNPLPGNPVIPNGGPGDWDQEYREIGNILYDPNDPDPSRLYKFTYCGYTPPYVQDQVWVGAAFSPDGVTWTKYGPKIIARAAEDPYVVLVDGIYYLFAEDKAAVPFRNIRRYHSSDFINWTDDGVVFDIQYGGDPPDWEAMDVSSPLVWIENGTWYLFYEGRGGGFLGRIGLATSTDGYSWTRFSDSPIFTEPLSGWDGMSQVPDDMVRVGGQYCMTYHGCNTSLQTGFWTGTAYSPDLLEWTASPGNPLLTDDTLMLVPLTDPPIGLAQDYGIGIGRYRSWRMSTATLYINGQVEVTTPKYDFQNGTINITTTPLSLGEQASSPHYEFLGCLDEVRLYNRTLSQDELLSLMSTPPAPPAMIGDVNCDGSIDFGDINPFVLVLTDLAAWEAAYPGCALDNADINQDGSIDFADINPFVALLTVLGGQQPD